MELGCGPADPAISKAQASYTGSGYGTRGGTGEVGTINPGANLPVASQGQAAQLRAYVLGGQLYFVDNITGTAYAIGTVVQVPQPSQLSVKETASTPIEIPAEPPKEIGSITLSNQDNEVMLSIGPYGDLWVTQKQGPNAGKAVDLTYGEWH
jgi:hypothetical protein